jgi:hypothetical protein
MRPFDHDRAMRTGTVNAKVQAGVTAGEATAFTRAIYVMSCLCLDDYCFLNTISQPSEASCACRQTNVGLGRIPSSPPAERSPALRLYIIHSSWLRLK